MTKASLSTLPAPLLQVISAVLAKATDGDCASLARLAAAETVMHAQARAASIVCASGAFVQARSGELPSAAQLKIAAWERALVKRIRQGSTALPDETIPVSTAQVDEWIVCMAPLVAGGQAVGALSLCVEAAREKEAIRTVQDLSPWLGAILTLAQGAASGNHHLSALMEIARIQPPRPDDDAGEWFRAALRRCAELLQAQGGLVVVLSEDGGRLHCLAADIPNEAVDWTGANLKAAGFLHHVCVSGQPLFSNDPVSDAQYAPDVEGTLVDSLHSILAVPFEMPGSGRGALALLNCRSAIGFTADDARWLASAAAILAASGQNDDMRRDTVETSRRMAEMQRSLRAEVAGAMHQGAVQLLAAVTMSLDHLEHLAAAQPDAVPNEIKSLKGLTREASREARLLLYELNPASLQSEGLASTLEGYIQQMSGGGENITFQHRGPISSIDPAVARTAFHVVVQGLRHAYAHGSASHVWLSLVLENESLSIELEDNGNPQAERRCARHDQEVDCAAFMRQQLSLVRGTLDIRADADSERPAFLIRIPV